MKRVAKSMLVSRAMRRSTSTVLLLFVLIVVFCCCALFMLLLQAQSHIHTHKQKAEVQRAEIFAKCANVQSAEFGRSKTRARDNAAAWPCPSAACQNYSVPNRNEGYK